MIAHDLDSEDDPLNVAHDLRDVTCTVLVGVVRMAENSLETTTARISATKRLLERIQKATGAETTFLWICKSSTTTTTTTTAMSVENRQSCVDWCLEHRAEMIESNLEDVFATHDSREKQGHARMHEALSAVQWVTMVLKQQRKEVIVEERVERIVEEEKTESASESETAPKSAPIPVLSASSAQQVSPSDDLDKTESNVFWDAMQSVVDGGGEDGGDTGLDGLSNLVSQARAVRRAGEQGTMSVEERHQNAMRVALQLASAMGLGEMGEEDFDFTDMMKELKEEN